MQYVKILNRKVNDNSCTQMQLEGWQSCLIQIKRTAMCAKARFKATEEISGTFTICNLPVHLVTNSFGVLITNEANKTMMFYNNKATSFTSTWASGTSYRMTGFGIYDYVL